MLDPRNGEVLGFSSRPAYDPNAFAGGVDRATWASLNTDELKPLQNRAVQGRYSPGSTFKMAVGLAGLEEGIITPEFRVNCGGGADVLRTLLQMLEEGRARQRRSPARDRAVVRRLLLHGREHARRRPHQQVGDAVRPRREVGIDLPNEVQGPRALDRVEGADTKEKWYAGRDDLGRDRPGAGVGDAGVDGGL